jgi:hypothetical protein
VLAAPYGMGEEIDMDTPGTALQPRVRGGSRQGRPAQETDPVADAVLVLVATGDLVEALVQERQTRMLDRAGAPLTG